MKTGIVTTTINLPTFLEAYFKNFREHGVKHKDVVFYLIGDQKQHPDTDDFVKRYTEYPVEWWNAKAQKEWIKMTFNGMEREVDFAIPWKSIRRRNLGYLMAMYDGCDNIITIDDDNLPTTSNWLKEHLDSFLIKNKYNNISSSNGIVNHCNILETNKPEYKIYPRGYPFNMMFGDISYLSKPDEKNRKVILNMGLWTNKPDVDSFTNFLHPDLYSKGLKDGVEKRAVDYLNFIAINTQNTAFRTEALPAFYLPRLDTDIYGHHFERYDDIWAGWMLQKIMHKMGHKVTYGTPLTRHNRNIHDMRKDLSVEITGTILNERLWRTILNIDFDCGNYFDGYQKLLEQLKQNIQPYKYHKNVADYYKTMFKSMGIWLNMVGRLT